MNFKVIGPANFESGYSSTTYAAIRWLKAVSQDIMVCDADKNLGSVIIARSLVTQIALDELNKACVCTSAETCLIDVWNSQNMVQDITMAHFRRGDLTERQKDFILDRRGTSILGCFRIRPKLHKTPPEGRPVFNFNASWIQPIAIYLSELLDPIVKCCNLVLHNTDQLLDRLKYLNLPLNSSLEIVIADVKHLYPSIDHSDLMCKISSRIRAFYSDRDSLASLLINLTSAIIKCQHIIFNDCTWKVLTGIGTGLACGAQLANLYLCALDDMLHAGTYFYGRYLDDVISIMPSSCSNSFIARANDFHDTIKVERTAHGRINIPYLDVALTLSDNGSLHFELYRKPGNLYQYLP